MHNQCRQLIEWLCSITLASSWWVKIKNIPPFSGATVPAAGKWTAAFSARCHPLKWITLMLYPSLFPACNEINATLICITLLLGFQAAEWMWHCLTAGHGGEKTTLGLGELWRACVCVCVCNWLVNGSYDVFFREFRNCFRSVVSHSSETIPLSPYMVLSYVQGAAVHPEIGR